MEQWSACLAKLEHSTRPAAGEVGAIIDELSALPYPLDFTRDPNAIGSLLCGVCRLARLDAQVSLAQVCELFVQLTTKHTVVISEGHIRDVVAFLCSAIEAPEVDAWQRAGLMRALSAIVYGNGERCSHVM
eukprot:COSAG04_NODE_14801_length_554_cov_2.107692_1_plen_130_part_01